MSTASILGNVQEMDPEEQRQALLGYLRPSQGIAPPVTSGAAAGLKLPAVGPSTLKSPTQRDSSPGNAQIPAKRVLGTLEGDQQNRSDLMNQSPGVMNIAHKIESSKFGQNHPTMGKILGWGAQVPAMIANTAIGATPIGHLALSQIPGTSAHQQLGIYRANQALTQDVDNEGKEAATERTKAETEQIKNPPDKFAPLPTDQGLQAFNPREGTATPLKDAAGNQLQPFSPEKVKTIDEQAYGTLISQGKTPVEALDTIYGSKNTKTEDLPHLYLDALQSGDQAKAALIKKAHQDTQVKPVQPPGITVIVPDGKGGGTVQHLTPGMKVAPGAQTVAGVNSMNTPTTQMRNVGAQASLVHEQTPQLLQQIDQMKDALGPVSGRWNEYMQGKIGMDNRQFADLRANLLMYSSAVALMHARGRLPENLREEFDRAINAPKQTPANLEAVIKRIDQWTSANMNAMQPGGEPGTETQSGSGLGVNLKDAMAFPQNKGKSEADVRKEIEAHGYKVVE